MYLQTVVILLLGAITHLISAGGYHDSCTDIYYDYYVEELCASCEEDVFPYPSRDTCINLNRCIGESNGYLLVRSTPDPPGLPRSY